MNKGQELIGELEDLHYRMGNAISLFMRVSPDELHHRYVFDFQRSQSQLNAAVDLIHLALEGLHSIDWTSEE